MCVEFERNFGYLLFTGDRWRPKLPVYPGITEREYINAVYIDVSIGRLVKYFSLQMTDII